MKVLAVAKLVWHKQNTYIITYYHAYVYTHILQRERIRYRPKMFPHKKQNKKIKKKVLVIFIPIQVMYGIYYFIPYRTTKHVFLRINLSYQLVNILNTDTRPTQLIQHAQAQILTVTY